MDEERLPGGYGNFSGPPNKNSNFGSDFISFGAEEPSNEPHKQWRPRGGRGGGGRPRLLSGTASQGPYQGGPSRGGWNNRGRGSNQWGSNQQQSGWNNRGRGSNQWGSNQQQSIHQRRGGHGGFDHHRGTRNQRHQGQRSSDSAQDISSYYHPSMIEDPWSELEKMFKAPIKQPNLSMDVDSEKLKHEEDSEPSVNSDGSE
ncbi:hypothetical protein ONE63_007370 [Megalurothrips usitatus]|uniref:Uncharacterized protein n=1 Tax=Megalurothrips usitatus TaxID=439358 RepID=A0AAV7XSD0_9NEOP|nr:hypothetical protein ONE63_007370 [Megalurothrips usitatus]